MIATKILPWTNCNARRNKGSLDTRDKYWTNQDCILHKYMITSLSLSLKKANYIILKKK